MASDKATSEIRRVRSRWVRFWPLWLTVAAFLVFAGIVVWRFAWRYLSFRHLKTFDGAIQTKGDTPKWLRSLIGDDVSQCLETVTYLRVSPTSLDIALPNLDSFASVEILAIDGPDIDASKVARLYDLKNVRWLMLEDVTNATLRDATKLDKLKQLGINASDVDDAGTDSIGKLSNLESLSLSKTRITDSGLSNFASLRNLKVLDLDGSLVTGSGFSQFAPDVPLKALDLANTRVDDAGLRDLPTFSELQRLILSKSRVTDAGLASLSRLPRLSSLDLDECKVTDGGMQSLSHVPSLHDVDLRETAVTWRGVKTLLMGSNVDVVLLSGMNGPEIQQLFDSLRASGLRRQFKLKLGPYDFVFRP
jgi:hypothetical protein